jgi:hypothetical protein
MCMSPTQLSEYVLLYLLYRYKSTNTGTWKYDNSPNAGSIVCSLVIALASTCIKALSGIKALLGALKAPLLLLRLY